MKRFEEIDVLRGIAALWVVLYHYLRRYDFIFSEGRRFPFDFPDGELGVYLFFIISGFVILMTLRNSRGSWDFVVSRVSRLYPAYWAGMLLTFTLGVLAPLPGQDYTLNQLAVNATMLQYYFYVPAIDGVYWSLAYELGFYAVMYLLFRRRLLDHVVPIGAVWLVLALLQFLAIERWDTGIPFRLSVLLVLKFAHLFVAGMVLHDIWRGRPSAAHAILLAAAIGMAFLVHGRVAGVCVLGFVVLFLAAIAGRLGWARLSPLVWLGGISYPLYLTHEFLGFRLIRWLETAGLPPAASVAITLAAALLLAELISRLIERPAMAGIRGLYRRRVSPQRAV